MDLEKKIKFSCSGGWAAKIAPMTLEQILLKLPKENKDENLLVGYDAHDDAAIYKVNEEISIVNTIDFFPPMVEEPYIFGQIAATNALSDIWAMGGKPIMALNITCFPDTYDNNLLEKMLVGGAEKVKEANCQLCGGHSIVNDTPIYGLAVTGLVNTNKVLKNNNVKVGDKLILTKPLGVGIIITAYKCDAATKKDYEKVINQMTTLNKYAAEILLKYKVNALTDVTGFGLFIHLDEMLSGNFSSKIYVNEVPFVSENVKKYIAEEYYTGASSRNRKAIEHKIERGHADDSFMEIGYDPQTSGGLLCSIDRNDVDAAMSELKKLDIESRIIGEIVEKRDKSIYLT